MLEDAGQASLAYVMAATHGLADTAERLATELTELPPLPQNAQLLRPPQPILKASAVLWAFFWFKRL